MISPRYITLIAAGAALVMTTALLAQAPADTNDEPAAVEGGTGSAAATQPTDRTEDLSLEKSLKSLDEGMSAEEIEAIVKKANENRLRVERQLVAIEMKSSGMPDPLVLDEAMKILDSGALNTQADNIQRICKAYARLDRKFGNLWKLYTAKQYAKAVVAGKDLQGTGSSYLGACKAYVYALSLEGADPKSEDAADAYGTLLENMYDRISFASEASLRRAQLYERLGRGLYAVEAYASLLRNYGLTLDQQTFETIYAKVKKLAQQYGDPMGTVAGMMSDVKERLAKADSGEATRKKQEEIVAMLNDLIKTAEDNESSSSANSSGKKKKSGQEQQGQKECKACDGAGCKSCNKSGPGGGKTPAEQSALRGGETTRAGKLASVHSGKDNGDWSSMPPERRQALEQARNKYVGERHRDIIRDYKTRIAEDE